MLLCWSMWNALADSVQAPNQLSSLINLYPIYFLCQVKGCVQHQKDQYDFPPFMEQESSEQKPSVLGLDVKVKWVPIIFLRPNSLIEPGNKTNKKKGRRNEQLQFQRNKLIGSNSANVFSRRKWKGNKMLKCFDILFQNRISVYYLPALLKGVKHPP